MTRVYLANVDPSADLGHWASAYAALDRSAALTAGRVGADACVRVDTPAQADVVLLLGTLRRDWWAMELRTHPARRDAAGKAVRFSTADREVAWMPGLYTSLTTSRAMPGLQGGFYPHAAFVRWVPDATPLTRRPGGSDPWLYTFVGAAGNHPIRMELAQLADPDGLFVDTTQHPGARTGAPEAAYADYHRQYAETLSRCRFVLCPRGVGPASIRVFEALRAGRVPVILSDTCVLPRGPCWNDCSIRVPEADVRHVPTLLRTREADWPEMAAAALLAWSTHFAADRVLAHAVMRARECLAEARRARLAAAGLHETARELVRRITGRLRKGRRGTHP